MSECKTCKILLVHFLNSETRWKIRKNWRLKFSWHCPFKVLPLASLPGLDWPSLRLSPRGCPSSQRQLLDGDETETNYPWVSVKLKKLKISDTCCMCENSLGQGIQQVNITVGLAESALSRIAQNNIIFINYCHFQ